MSKTYLTAIGSDIKMTVDIAQSFKIGNLAISYWGISQWYKWRWSEDHIDLGMWSVYNLPEKGIGKLFWRYISIAIKPMRWAYHKFVVYRYRRDRLW